VAHAPIFGPPTSARRTRYKIVAGLRGWAASRRGGAEREGDFGHWRGTPGRSLESAGRRRATRGRGPLKLYSFLVLSLGERGSPVSSTRRAAALPINPESLPCPGFLPLT
jgi:hypothetical protein